MTENKAIRIHIHDNARRIEVIKEFMENNKGADERECKRNIFALEEANKALSEIQQYRSIGTVEECRAAMERKSAKKPLSITHCKDGNHPLSQDIGRCPCCNGIVAENMIWCDDCGQKLDWSDTP